METKIFKDDMSEAAEIIRNGGLVAVPTETVYGLAGNGLDEKAVKEIYEVKGRPAIKPLSLMVPGEEAMDRFCVDVPEQARVLARKFWPGPLTIVLKARDFIPSIVLAGGKTVGLRCPQHDMTLELLHRSGVPFAAPSANPSGSESPKTAQKVLEYFDGKIDAVADGGPCGIGFESTIIDMTSVPYRILRQGALSKEAIEKALVDGMKVIGITGGTGSGKTTALSVLKDMGAAVLDCDRIYHGLLESSEPMMEELRVNFPQTFESGEFDRKALGRIVFADDEQLKKLNSIAHRYVAQEVGRLLAEHAMAGGLLAAVDAVELHSGRLADRCCATVAVTAPKELRAQRIMERDGIGMEYAMMRIEAQKSDSFYAESCSHTLVNDCGIDEFALKCKKLFEEILSNG